MDVFALAFTIFLVFSNDIHIYSCQTLEEIEHQLANHCILHMVGFDYSIPGKKFKRRKNNESD